MAGVQKMPGLLDRVVDPRWIGMGRAHERRREYKTLEGILARCGLPSDGPTVLCPGSGKGGIFRFESGPLFDGWTVVGFDIEHDKLLQAIVPVCRGDIETTPFLSESADIVFFDLVLHHLIVPRPLLETAIAEAFRCLKPGGLLIAFEPNLWNPVGASIELARRVGIVTRIRGQDDDVPLSPRYLRRVLEQHGRFVAIEPVTFNWRRLPPFVQKLVIGVEPYLLRSPLSIFARTLMFVARKEAAA